MEARQIMGGTPWAHGDGREAERRRPVRKGLPQIQVARTTGRDALNGFQYLGTDLVASTANTHPTMHYELSGVGAGRGGEHVHPALDDPSGRPSPPRVQQGDRAGPRLQQIDWDAVRDQHSKQESPPFRQVAVGLRKHGSTSHALAMMADFDAVDLTPEYDSTELAVRDVENPLPVVRRSRPPVQAQRLGRISSGDTGYHTIL